MDNVKNDLFYLEKLREDLKFIVAHTKDISLEELGKNEILLDSMLFRLIQVSESSRKLSDKFKNASPDIPWIKSLQMVTAAMKLKDACSLEENL